MNSNKLVKLKYYRVKLRPYAIWLSKKGRILPYKDDIWVINSASQYKLTINHPGTDREVNLPRDAIHDFRESIVDITHDEKQQGILKLLGFIWIFNNDSFFEPLSLPTAENLFLKQWFNSRLVSSAASPTI